MNTPKIGIHNIENLDFRKMIESKYPNGWNIQIDSSKLWWQDKEIREHTDEEIAEFAIAKLNDALQQNDFSNIRHYCEILKLKPSDAEINNLIQKPESTLAAPSPFPNENRK